MAKNPENPLLGREGASPLLQGKESVEPAEDNSSILGKEVKRKKKDARIEAPEKNVTKENVDQLKEKEDKNFNPKEILAILREDKEHALGENPSWEDIEKALSRYHSETDSYKNALIQNFQEFLFENASHSTSHKEAEEEMHQALEDFFGDVKKSEELEGHLKEQKDASERDEDLLLKGEARISDIYTYLRIPQNSLAEEKIDALYNTYEILDDKGFENLSDAEKVAFKKLDEMLSPMNGKTTEERISILEKEEQKNRGGMLPGKKRAKLNVDIRNYEEDRATYKEKVREVGKLKKTSFEQKNTPFGEGILDQNEQERIKLEKDLEEAFKEEQEEQKKSEKEYQEKYQQHYQLEEAFKEEQEEQKKSEKEYQEKYEKHYSEKLASSDESDEERKEREIEQYKREVANEANEARENATDDDNEDQQEAPSERPTNGKVKKERYWDGVKRRWGSRNEEFPVEMGVARGTGKAALFGVGALFAGIGGLVRIGWRAVKQLPKVVGDFFTEIGLGVGKFRTELWNSYLWLRHGHRHGGGGEHKGKR